MNAVITGSNGFIGSSLVENLLAEGADVRCLVRSKPRSEAPDKAKRYVIDYASEKSIINSGALDNADVIFHVAGVTKHLTLEGFRKGNVMPTQNLLEAAKKQAPLLKRFVLISSQAAAGPALHLKQPITEQTPPKPIEEYGLSKLEAENLLRNGDHPFSYTIIRPPAVYGPRDVDFLPLFKQIGAGRGIYPGNKHSYISLIHVQDLVDGILRAATSPSAENQTYFLTNEETITWQQVYQTISKVLGKSIWELNIPLPLIAFAARLGDLYSKLTGTISILNSKKIELAKPKLWICTADKAKQEFNFTPTIPMMEGMATTFEWYKKQGWV